MTLIRIASLYLFLTLSIPIPAQTADPDSLTLLLPRAELRQRVLILNQLADYYAPLNFDSSIMYSAQAMRIGTVYGDPEGIALARLFTGNAYYYKMDMKNALLSYLSAQKLLEECNLTDKLGDLNQQLGNVNFFIRRLEKATSYYRKAFAYYQASGNKKSLYGAYHAMSMTFFWDNLSGDSALVYARKCLQNARKRSDPVHEAYALTMIGMIYSVETTLPEKQKALPYCDSAVRMALKLNEYGPLTINYINLGGYYDRSSPLFEVTGNFDSARYYYGKALEITQQTKELISEAIILDYLAEIYIEEGNYKQAEANLNLSEKRLQEYSHTRFGSFQGDVLYPFLKVNDYFLFRREKNAFFKVRFNLAQAQGDYQKAVAYQRSYYQTLDSLKAAQEGQQLELLMAEAEAERTDQRFRMLSQESELSRMRLSRSRTTFIGITAGVLMISLTVLFFFQRRRLRAEQKSILMEQRLLRAQMNPHFLFNSLASIQNYIINQDTDQASIYLSRFSRLVRNILDNSVEEAVPLEKEIDTIRNYLELQKVRYAGKFDFTITVDERLDEENTMIPPMLAQPFIENAIEHGINHKETNGHIDIRFGMDDGIMRFEVEDDGVGRKKALEIESKQKTRHRSMATSITRDRLAVINKNHRRKINMEIIDLKDKAGNGCGTKVRFGIPIRIV
jgi:tetratricopeptide (TPR) repeat protein